MFFSARFGAPAGVGGANAASVAMVATGASPVGSSTAGDSRGTSVLFALRVDWPPRLVVDLWFAVLPLSPEVLWGVPFFEVGLDMVTLLLWCSPCDGFDKITARCAPVPPR